MVVIKIFDAKDTNFNTAGNIIIEPLYCHEIKKKSLNGWYIDVEIPINYKEFIEQDKLCVVQTKSKLNPQAFRIKDIEYTTNKIVFQAQHVMFDAEDYFLLDSRPTNQNGLNALNYINGMTDKVSPFTMYSNVENISTAYFIRKNLLEAWSIIEERWGGIFDADNWNISFLTSVGNDNGETIYYGKNLEDMKIIEDWSSVCTKLYPVGKDEIMLADKYMESATQYDIPYTRTINFDTELSDEEQTQENLLIELETNATNYLQENCVPKVCYEINSNINQDMEIGDIIQVKHPLCNISTEVLEYEYDVILRKIIKLVFGNYSKDVKKKFKAVTNTIESIKEAVNKQQTTINNQTNLINSLNKNGYVYIDENEILLLDAIPKEKAKNVWRFGLAGIGFSSNGYEGPFEVAITMDGQINANFITTGTMSVSRIEGLANFISETEKQIAEIEIEQGNITSRVSSLETTAESLQAQIDGAIQFWNGSEIPTVSNYPANEWKTEADKNNHRADIYTVIEDVDGELKQGKSYRFDKVGNTWQWIELTDNELSAVQALATSKAKVFVATPTVPYSVGDLWLNNGKLSRCKTAKDSNGSYSSSDWEIAVNYTDDTVAELAKTLANNAQSTADNAVDRVNNITNTQGEAEGKNIHIEDSAEEPFVDVELYGESVQEGTPTPDSPSEIENIEGKNKFNYKKLTPTFNINGDEKEFTITAPNVGTTVYEYTGFKTSKQYTLSGFYSSTSLNGVFRIKYSDNTYTVIKAIYDGSAVSKTKFSVTSTVNKTIVSIQFILYGNTYDLTFYDFQVEEGTVATPYVPYNSLEFKVEGKNLQNTNLRNGIYNANTGEYSANSNYLANTDIISVKPSTLYSFSSDLGYSFEAYLYDKNKQFIAKAFATDNAFTTSEETYYINWRTLTSGQNNLDCKVQLEFGEPTDYEQYKFQTAYFPLAEGQKLMEGSYLADDGIHHIRKQYVFTGQENWNEYTASGEYSDDLHCYFGLHDVILNSKMAMKSSICSHFKNPGTWVIVPSVAQYGTYQDNPNIRHRYFITNISTLAEWKKWLSDQYANGTPITVEYELAEPEVVPYTEEQQEAWNRIKILMTYKNITNITSDAYAKVVYMRDNGLDVYETKQNAQKRYTETSEKLAEQKMTVDGVITQVSDITSKTDELTGEVKTINSEISTVKQTIEGWSSELKNTGGNNIFYYSLDFWDNSNGLQEYSDTEIMQNSISQTGYVLNNGSAKQTQSVKNGFYTCSFNYKKLLELAVCQVKINDTIYDLTETDWAEFEQAFEVKTNKIEIEFISDTDKSLYISDLMVNVGTTKLSWSQNANETRTDTVTIGKGIQVNSSAKNTYHRIDADGNRTFNKATGKVVNEATDKGTETEELVVRGQAKITGLLLQKVSDQVWINSLL